MTECCCQWIPICISNLSLWGKNNVSFNALVSSTEQKWLCWLRGNVQQKSVTWIIYFFIMGSEHPLTSDLIWATNAHFLLAHRNWWNACKRLFDWLRVVYFHKVKNSSIIDGNEANWDQMMRHENKMGTAEGWRERMSTKQGWREVWGGVLGGRDMRLNRDM